MRTLERNLAVDHRRGRHCLLSLTGSLDEGELPSSRLTRREVRRQILIIAENADRLPAETRKRMAELDREDRAITTRQRGG